MEILKMEHITKIFPGVIALDDVSFSCRAGELHALVGENGAGKSTLIKILSGAYHPDEGEIIFKGKIIKLLSPINAQRAGIATIYQEFNLIPYLNATENIFLGREKLIRGFIKYKEMESEANAIMGTLGVKINMKIPVNRLSIAQQQMVEIAKALSMEASLIIMDEPTSSLTEQEIRALFNIIHKLKERHVTIIYISHRLEEIFEIADRVSVLKDGQLMGTMSVSGIDKSMIIKMMVGRNLSKLFPDRHTNCGELLLEVRGLRREGVLADVTFNLHEGEVLGIGGLVGAGRTELARTIFGADIADDGELIVAGEKVSIKCPSDAIKNKIGFIPEDRKNQGLVQIMSIRHNMTLPILDVLLNRIFISKKKEDHIVNEYIEKLKIAPQECGRLVMHLSGGNQQKVVIAKWLAKNCKILIMDEPTRGIDVGAKVEVYNLIRELTRQGIGVILITSELPELLAISDRIVVLQNRTIKGEFVACDATEEDIIGCAMGGV